MTDNAKRNKAIVRDIADTIVSPERTYDGAGRRAECLCEPDALRMF